jgi:DNA-binding response OmpR family regulator
MMITTAPAEQEVVVVLIAEDDKELARTLSNAMARELASSGVFLKPVFADHVVQAEKHIDSVVIDIALIDLNMPIEAEGPVENLSGIRILNKIFGRLDIGTLIFSSEPVERMGSVLIDAGADFYVQKPSDIKYVISTIKSLHRRRRVFQEANKERNVAYEFSKYKFVEGRREVAISDGNPIPLTQNEYSLMKYIVGSPDRSITARDFFEKVLGIEFSEFDRSFDNVIYRMRKKLGEDFVSFDRASNSYKLRN